MASSPNPPRCRGRASQCSSAHTRCSRSAAIEPARSPPPFGITFTGRSSWAATASSRCLLRGSDASTPPTSRSDPGWTMPSMNGSSTSFGGISRTSSGPTSRTGWPSRNSMTSRRPSGRSASSSRPTTSSSTRCRTRSCRTPTPRPADVTDGAVPPAVQPSAPPNDLPAERLHLRGGRGDVRLDPATAGWRYLSFAVLELTAGDVRSFGQADHETAVVVLAGGGARVRHKRTSFELVGRASPFEALPTALYLPAELFGDRQPTIEAVPSVAGSRVTLAVASAPSSARSATATRPILIEPSDVRIEVRGAGNATRQINHIIAPDFPAERLEVVEVLTPSGNWSSWPPHKHD